MLIICGMKLCNAYLVFIVIFLLVAHYILFHILTQIIQLLVHLLSVLLNVVHMWRRSQRSGARTRWQEVRRSCVLLFLTFNCEERRVILRLASLILWFGLVRLPLIKVLR
jgi:hypothetical protein